MTLLEAKALSRNEAKHEQRLSAMAGVRDEAIDQLHSAQSALKWLEDWFRDNIDAGGKHACPFCYMAEEQKSWAEITHADGCVIGKALKG